MSAVLGAGYHQGKIKCYHAPIAQEFRHITGDNFLGEPFHNGRLSHAGFTEEYGIILGAAAENLDDALDFVGPADYRIHLAFAGDLGEIAAEGAQRGRLIALFAALCRCGLLAFLFLLHLLIAHGEVGIEFLENFLAGLFDINVEILKHARGNSVAFTQEPQQNVLGAHVGVLQLLGFL